MEEQKKEEHNEMEEQKKEEHNEMEEQKKQNDPAVQSSYLREGEVVS
jgi:hypothetical protein